MSLESQIDSAQSAQRQAEVARAESERRYRHLFEHTLALIRVYDLEGRLLSVNPAAIRSLGYESVKVAGRLVRLRMCWATPSTSPNAFVPNGPCAIASTR